MTMNNNPMIRSAIISTLLLLAVMVGIWLLLPSTSHVVKSIHGADCITTDWKGSETAYKWDGKQYVIMWKRL